MPGRRMKTDRSPLSYNLKNYLRMERLWATKPEGVGKSEKEIAAVVFIADIRPDISACDQCGG